MKPVVAIFAHPDDEAFGASGTLALLAKERPVYLVCVTDGSEGLNSGDRTELLEDIRKDELLESAKVLGIKDVFFLGFKDGSLSNNIYHKVAEKLLDLLPILEPEILLTDELRGVSGHLDHIAVSFITTYVFERLESAKELWYYCVTKDRRAKVKDYFVYFPPGYDDSQIDKKVDVESVWETKVSAMHQHQSQAHDIKRVLDEISPLPKVENFIVLKK